jgi:branched-chain amino acid transport system substrate-binding protein
MMNRRHFAFGTLAVGSALSAVPRAARAAGEPLKIGMTYPLTGPLAPLAGENLIAAQVAVDEVNKAGGIKGRPLQLVTEDTQGTPQGGVAAMRKLVEIDHVIAIESVYTNIVTAQIPLADDLKVPLLTTTESPGLMAKSQYAFSHAATFGTNLPHYVKYWKAKNVKKIVGFLTNNALGLQQSTFMKDVAQQIGAQYTEALLDPNATDFRGQIARAQDVNPDVIVLTGQGSSVEAAAIKQAREAGVKAMICVLSNGWASKAFRDGVGPYSEGLIFGGLALDPRTAPAFVAAYKAKAGYVPAFTSAEVYDVIKLIAYGLDRTNGAGGDALRAVIADVKGARSVLGGTITMGPDHQTLPGAVSLWQIRSGEEIKIPGT